VSWGYWAAIITALVIWAEILWGFAAFLLACSIITSLSMSTAWVKWVVVNAEIGYIAVLFMSAPVMATEVRLVISIVAGLFLWAPVIWATVGILAAT
jgi:hypothetical protein